MDAASLIVTARRRSGLSLRVLASRCGTSHSTLAAYEGRRKTPTVSTLDRILRAAGFEARVSLVDQPQHPGARAIADGEDPAARGRELVEALHLAAMFPARHDPELRYPRFGAAP